MFPGILPKDKGFIVQQTTQRSKQNEKTKKAFSTSPSQFSEQPQVQLKHYNFTLPSVAVWQDINELGPSQRSKTSPKKKKARKSDRSILEEEDVPISLGIMKR